MTPGRGRAIHQVEYDRMPMRPTAARLSAQGVRVASTTFVPSTAWRPWGLWRQDQIDVSDFTRLIDVVYDRRGEGS